MKESISVHKNNCNKGGTKQMNAYETSGLYYVDKNIGYNDNAKPTVQEQILTKPDIDDIICHYLDGNILKDALNFIEHIRNTKMKIKWSSFNVWSVRFKRKHVMDIRVAESGMSVRLVYNHIHTGRGFVSQSDLEAVKMLMGSLTRSTSQIREPRYAAFSA
jgi:hypothetical protein